MLYGQVLSQVFPYLVKVTREEAQEAITAILDKGRSNVPQASSFALTVDNWDGTWNLWLSSVSYSFIEDCYKQGMWKGKDKTLIRTQLGE